MIVSSSRLSFYEAIRHKRRSIKNSDKKLSWLSVAYDYLDCLYHSFYYDPYGVLQKDFLIMGEDHFMNAVCAFILARKGFSVLIASDGVSEDKRISCRYEMKFPGMSEIICNSLAIDYNPKKELIELIADESRGLSNEDGINLIHQIRGSTLAHDRSVERHSFWADPVEREFNDLGFEFLDFWDKSDFISLKNDGDKFPRFRAEFGAIILTSSSQYSRLKSQKTPVIATGDALNPLSDFDYFRSSDRLREILDTIKAINNVENISAAS